MWDADAAACVPWQACRRSAVIAGLPLRPRLRSGLSSTIRRRHRLRARRRAPPPLTPPWRRPRQLLWGLPVPAIAAAAVALYCSCSVSSVGVASAGAAGAGATRRRAARRMRSSSPCRAHALEHHRNAVHAARRQSSRRHRRARLPAGWTTAVDPDSGDAYFYNDITGESGGSGRSTKLFLRSSAHLPSGPHHRRILAAGSASLGGGEDVEAREAHPGVHRRGDGDAVVDRGAHLKRQSLVEAGEAGDCRPSR